MLLLSQWSQNPCQFLGLGYVSSWGNIWTKQLIQGASCTCFPPTLMPILSHGSDFPRTMARRGSARRRYLQAIDTGHESGVDSLPHSCLISQFIPEQCFVGYDCGFLDLVPKKRRQKAVFCCAGEPMLLLQSLEKVVVCNGGCLIMVGQGYSST